MTLVQLEYALAVQRLGSISKAAEERNVTQPTLTLQLKKLEDQLGATLFDRSRHPLRATAAGYSLLQQAQRVVAEASKLKSLASDQGEPLAGPFRLAVIPSAAGALMPLLVPAVRRHLPKLRLSVTEAQTSSLVAGLKDGRFDAGIAAVPLEDPSLEIRPLYQEGFRVFLPPRHALLKRKSIAPELLQHEALLLMGEGHCFRNQALEICRFQAGDDPFFMESGSFETMIEMVNQGNGITILPQLTAKRLAPPQAKRLRPFAGREPVRAMAMLQVASSLRGKAAAEIAARIQTTVNLGELNRAQVLKPGIELKAKPSFPVNGPRKS